MNHSIESMSKEANGLLKIHCIDWQRMLKSNTAQIQQQQQLSKKIKQDSYVYRSN